MNLFGGWLVLTTCINAGGCNRKMRISGYVRKHNPFISFRNIQNDWRRCSKIVNSIQLDRDIVSDMVPQYVFYTPDVRRTRRHLSLFSHRHYQPIKKNRRSRMTDMTQTSLMRRNGWDGSWIYGCPVQLLQRTHCSSLHLTKMTATPTRIAYTRSYLDLISSGHLLHAKMTSITIIIHCCEP